MLNCLARQPRRVYNAARMKTHHIFALAACAALCIAGHAHAATALGLTAEEMTELYGAGFAKQTAEAQKLMDEEWDEDTEEETPQETATETAEPAQPQADDTPAPETETPAAETEPEPQPAADSEKPQEDTAADKKGDKKDGKDDAKEAAKKKLLKKTIMLVKTKRAVDAKIKASRNNITNLRKKLYGVAKKYNVHPSETYTGGEYSENLKNLDLIVVKNSQVAIQKYKDAIPQLWSFSNELSMHIAKGLKSIGKTKNKVLLSFDPNDAQPADGSETQKDVIDKYNYKNIYSGTYDYSNY